MGHDTESKNYCLQATGLGPVKVLHGTYLLKASLNSREALKTTTGASGVGRVPGPVFEPGAPKCESEMYRYFGGVTCP
jgi:hypothetical protein